LQEFFLELIEIARYEAWKEIDVVMIRHQKGSEIKPVCRRQERKAHSLKNSNAVIDRLIRNGD